MKTKLLFSTVLLSQMFSATVNAQVFNSDIISNPNRRLQIHKKYRVLRPNEPVPSSLRYFIKKGKPYLQVKKGQFKSLIPKQEMIKQLTRKEKLNALNGTFFPLLSNLCFSNRHKQTDVKNQGSRGTCVAHASLASLERFYSKNMDLSEQYAYMMYETQPTENCNGQGLKTTNSAQYLQDNGIPLESVWNYSGTRWNDTNKPDLNDCQQNVHNDPDNSLPTNISNNSLKYKIGSFQIIGDNDKTNTNSNRKTIDNAKYLKSIIGAGYDIVAGLYVTGPDWANDGVAEDTETVDATPGVDGCTVGGDTNACSGGHALVLVGYCDIGKYFIAKNSWGDGFKDDGFMKISYNYMKHYGKYGYYIQSAVKQLGSYKKTIFRNKTKVKRKISHVKKGIRYTSPKLKVDKKGSISLSISRNQVFPIGFGKMTLMIFKEGTPNRVARIDSNSKTISLSYPVDSSSKFGKYYYQVVKFNNQLPEDGTTKFTVPVKNL